MVIIIPYKETEVHILNKDNISLHYTKNGLKYSRMDEVKFVEDSLLSLK